MCVIKAMAPARFPELPAPGRAWQAVSLGHRAGSSWQSEGGWAPQAEPGAARAASPVRLSSLGEVPGGGPQSRFPLWRLAFPVQRLRGAGGPRGRRRARRAHSALVRRRQDSYTALFYRRGH